MPRIFEENGEPIVDMSGEQRGHKQLQNRSKQTSYSNIDLSSGYPKNQIWTTKDGRRIPVPLMGDEHLLNTIAFLRRRVQQYKNKMAVQFIMNVTATIMMFDHIPDRVIEDYSDETMREIDKLRSLADDDFLRRVFPIFSILLQEAYKRKILIEGNTSDA